MLLTGEVSWRVTVSPPSETVTLSPSTSSSGAPPLITRSLSLGEGGGVEGDNNDSNNDGMHTGILTCLLRAHKDC